MAYLRCALVVLTLLQLCRGEIQDALPEWYSANVINDGFQPKSISEIFTTDPPFSSANPIIVMPTSTPPSEVIVLSTLPPTFSPTLTTPGEITKVPPLPSMSTTTVASDISTKQSIPNVQPQSNIQPVQAMEIETQPELRGPIQQVVEPVQLQPEPQPVQPIQLQPEAEDQIQIQPQSVIPFNFQQTQPPQMFTENLSPEVQNQSQTGGRQTQTQQIRFELVSPLQSEQLAQPIPPQSQQPVSQVNSESSTNLPQSNYIVIYQQAPQSFQNYPFFPPTSDETSQPSTNPVPRTTIPPPIVRVNVTTVQQTSPSQTTVPTITQTDSTQSTFTVPTQSTVLIPRGPLPNCVNTTTSQPRPPVTTPKASVSQPAVGSQPVPLNFPLKIRVVAPSGSITNVNINPVSTTKRPATTRRTTRKPRPKKNNYDSCVNGCKGRRDPICAAPLSTGIIDSKVLKGFPSICHMACHNSFRKERYEKLVDGRCGKLRTRIRPIDSKTKLKRDELNKAEYTIESAAPHTIIELSRSSS